VILIAAPFNSRSVDLFNALNWISFYRDSHRNQCTLIYKRLQGNTPNYLSDLLVINSNMHTRNTRYCNLNLFCPRYKLRLHSSSARGNSVGNCPGLGSVWVSGQV